MTVIRRGGSSTAFASRKPKALVGVGAFYLDTILTVDQFPAEDEKQKALSISKRRGGNVPNTFEVLQQLLLQGSDSSHSLVLIAVLPSRSSPAAELIKSSLGSAINLSYCLYREDHVEPASAYVIKSLAADSRTILNYNQLPEMTSDEFIAFADQLPNDSDSWYHFEGRIPDVNLDNLRHLRQNHPLVTISVEVEKPGRPGLQELAALADVVFYSKSWAQGHGFQGPEQCLQAQAPLTPKASLLCCTWGDQGCAALEIPSMTYTTRPAYAPNGYKVIDTLGAGDTFIAGMLYGLTCRSKDWTVMRMLEFANELAGRKVAQDGFSGLGKKMMHYV